MHFVEKFGKIGTLLSAERNERGESISVSIFSPTSWFAPIKKTADEDEAIRWKWRSDLGGNFRRSCLTEETDSALLATKRQKFYDFWAEQHFCSCKKGTLFGCGQVYLISIIVTTRNQNRNRQIMEIWIKEHMARTVKRQYVQKSGEPLDHLHQVYYQVENCNALRPSKKMFRNLYPASGNWYLGLISGSDCTVCF